MISNTCLVIRIDNNNKIKQILIIIIIIIIRMQSILEYIQYQFVNYFTCNTVIQSQFVHVKIDFPGREYNMHLHIL